MNCTFITTVCDREGLVNVIVGEWGIKVILDVSLIHYEI